LSSSKIFKYVIELFIGHAVYSVLDFERARGTDNGYILRTGIG
jgi:hypothetical protein